MIMNKNILLTLFLVLLVNSVSAQNVIWSNVYGGEEREWGRGIVQANDGGYVVAGKTESFADGSFDLWVLKTDVNGNEIWNQSWGGNGFEGANAIRKTHDNGYVVAGYTKPFGSPYNNAYIGKLNDDGHVVWESAFGGAPSDLAKDVVPLDDGSFILVGTTESYGENTPNILLVKVDENGDEEWIQAIDGGSYDYTVNAILSNDGNIIVCTTVNYCESKLYKIDLEGNIIWERSIGDWNDLGARWMTNTSDGGYIVVSNIITDTENEADVLLIKLDSNGSEQWQRTYSSLRDDYAEHVIQTEDDGYLVTGYKEMSGIQNDNLLMMKINSDGELEWEQLYGGSSIDQIYCALQDLDGNYVLTGDTRSYGALDLDLWLIKIANGLSVDESELSPAKFAVTDIYPNPFNANTNINFNVSERCFVDISLHNLLGRKLFTIRKDNFSPGSYSIYLNAGTLASGMYYIRAESKDNEVLKKITLLK